MQPEVWVLEQVRGLRIDLEEVLVEQIEVEAVHIASVEQTTTSPLSSVAHALRQSRALVRVDGTRRSGQQVEVLLASWHRVENKFIPAFEDEDDGLQ